MKYRDHRASLDESMETLQEMPSRAALVAYLKSDLERYGYVVEPDMVVIEPYVPGHLSGWDDVHIVLIRGVGVVGFCDGPLE